MNVTDRGIFRWLTIATLGLGGLIGRRLYRQYRTDIRDAHARVTDSDTEICETPLGNVEYRTSGEGLPVLVSHGIFGGVDQSIQSGEGLFGDDVRHIGVSRFGYLGSDLPDEPTPANQARAFASVLDELDVDDAVVVGTSAGGAPAIKFGLDFPARTRGLVLVGSTAPSLNTPRVTGPPHAILRDPIFWTLVRYAPRVLHVLFGIDSSEYSAAPPEARRRVEGLLESLLPVEPRVEGIHNDELVTNRAMAGADEDYPLETLDIPTLVIHAEDDPLASFSDAASMADRIPRAELLRFETGGHLVFGHRDTIQESLSEFLSEIQ